MDIWAEEVEKKEERRVAVATTNVLLIANFIL